MTEAIRLALATLAHVSKYPALLNLGPMPVLADVLNKPPWSMDWVEAYRLVAKVLRETESGNA